MSQFTLQRVSEERNKRLIVWLADQLKLEGNKRQQLASEMTLLFAHVTDKELAEFIWEKLCSKKIVKNAEDAQKVIRHFHDIAQGWFSNTSDDRRN